MKTFNKFLPLLLIIFTIGSLLVIFISPNHTTKSKQSETYFHQQFTNLQTFYQQNPTQENAVKFQNQYSSISFYTLPKQSFGESNSRPQINKSSNTITYENIFINTHLRYTTTEKRLLEEFIILNSETAQKMTTITQMVFLEPDITYHHQDNEIKFFKDNQLIALTPKPVMYELNNPQNRSYGIDYQISPINSNKIKVSKVINSEGFLWLTNPSRSYPIVIDLVIDNADTYTNWVSSDSSNLIVTQETSTKYEGTGSVKLTAYSYFGSGADGDLTFSGTFNLNSSTSGSRSYADGIAYRVTAPSDSSTYVSRYSGGVTLSNGIAVGDEVLIINLQGAGADYADVGNYEFMRVASVGASSIHFTAAITKSYNGTTASNQKVVVQRVPNYRNVTLDSTDILTAYAWDGLATTPSGTAGYRTGIVTFRATGNISVSSGSSIDAATLGYRDGAGGELFRPATGYQGESIAGTGGQSTVANLGAGGGGYTGDCEANCDGGGGGGSYGTAGSNGTTVGGSGATGGQPGVTYGTSSLSTIFYGSGGGHGEKSNNIVTGPGGGIVYVSANSIGITGYVLASGDTDGADMSANSAGGSIFLIGNSLNIGTSRVLATGGTNANLNGESGSGRIRIEYNTSLTGTASPIASTSPSISNTYSLNDTTTLTIGSTNLSTSDGITFWVYSTGRTGTFAQFQFGEVLSSEQTFPFSIDSANSWEQKIWDISGITSTARDAVTKFAFKITDASIASEFYFDDIQASTELPPSVPTLIQPANLATGQSLAPIFKTVTTDVNDDTIQYELKICTNASMSSGCATYNQVTNNTGWSGQNVGTSAYSSGTTATYTIQAGSTLAFNTTYYWKTRAIDPYGSNSWGETQGSPFSFTTYTINIPGDCLIEESPTDSGLKIKWIDKSSDEIGYSIEKSTDGSAYSALTTVGAGITGYSDSAATTGHTYQYRVAPYTTGPLYGEWCYSPLLNLQRGKMQYNGIIFR